MSNAMIKFIDGQKIGFLKKKNEKFYLSIQNPDVSIITIVPIEIEESLFCGLVKGREIVEVPKEFETQIERNRKELIYLNEVLQASNKNYA